MRRFSFGLLAYLLSSACIPAPGPVVTRGLWAQCQGSFEECSQAIEQSLNFDEASFAPSPPFEGDPGKSSALNRSFAPPESAGPRVKRLILTGLWYLARTPLQIWDFTDAELKRSKLKQAFSPPLWREIIKHAQEQKLDFRLVLFQWILERVGGVRYEGGDPDPNFIARYDFFGKNELGQISFNSRFITGVRSGFTFVEGMSAGSVILHEATHGSVTVHGSCVRDPQGSCDNTLNGPYGMEVLFGLASIKAGLAGSVDRGALASLAQRTCTMLRDQINFLPSEYAQNIDSVLICSVTSALDWFARLDSALTRQ